MSEQLDDRITEILNAADAESGSVLTADGDESDDAGRNLLSVADEASDLLESTEPRELLEAVGLGTLPDGSEPETLPEAIAKGDSDDVEKLHRLLRLAKLADRSDEREVEETLGELRTAIDRARTEEDDESMTDDAQSEQEADEEDRDADVDEDETADESGASDDLGERLRSAMSASVGGFGDEIASIQDRLEDASTALADDEDESEDDGAEPDEADADGDEETDEEDEEDDGILGSGLGSEETSDFGSSDSSRHSTMAPPPSERADMRAVKRHSTMPKKNKNKK